MSAEDIVFIDANQYLDLYRTASGKQLLAGIQEQQANILVTAQVVDEVNRQKVKETAFFLADSPMKLDMRSVATANRVLVVRTHEQLQKIRRKLTSDLLRQVSLRMRCQPGSLVFFLMRWRITKPNYNARGNGRNAATRRARKAALLATN